MSVSTLLQRLAARPVPAVPGAEVEPGTLEAPPLLTVPAVPAVPTKKTAGQAEAGKLPERPDHGPAGPLDGLPLLAGDWRFIQRMARGRHRHALLLEYGHRWRQAADAEPAPHRKAGAGRLAANSWLLEAGQ
jgi:hypothetical protein